MAPFFTPRIIKPPLSVPKGGTVFEALACCDPPLPGKAIKLFFFSFAQNSVSAFLFGTGDRGRVPATMLENESRYLHVRKLIFSHQPLEILLPRVHLLVHIIAKTLTNIFLIVNKIILR